LAANELFGLIKERVEGMGGAKAWRESRKRQREFYGEFEEDKRGIEKDEDGGGKGERNDEADEGDEEEQQDESVSWREVDGRGLALTPRRSLQCS
jgi:hypothetical protein